MNKYVGIPFEDKGESFEGSDCYGIIRLIYKEQRNIEIPAFHGSCYSTKLIFSDYLKQISEHWELVDVPEMLDVIAMAHDPQHPKIVQHFGVYIGSGMMIHTLEGIGSHVVQMHDLSYYIKGIYRWRQH